LKIVHRKGLAGGIAAVALTGLALAALGPLTAEASAPAAAAAAAPYDPPAFPETHIGPANNPDLPNIVVIDAGGTITSRASDRISYLNYQGSVAGGVQTILEDMYPELARVANLTVARSTGSLSSSSSVSFKTLFDISRKADEYLARDDVDGVVVTAGTNVLEEDAYFLDLTIQSAKPVVMTGSMHQYGTFTYDGYTNLFSSIRLAASEKTTCYGTVVLLNDQFFASREVIKQDGYRMDTFGGGAYGALGVVNQENIRTMRAPARVQTCGSNEWRTPFDLRTIAPTDLAKVELINGYVEASGAPIDALVAAGVEGIVSSGHGPGGLSSAQSTPRRNALTAGVTFVSTSRTGGEGNYDSGTGADNSINGGDLSAQKARVLLMLGLTYSDDQAEVRRWFTGIGNPEFDFSGTDDTEVPPPATVVDPSAVTIKVPATRYGTAATGTVALTADDEPIGGVVAVSVDGGTPTNVTVTGGAGTISLGSALTVGSHAVTVTFAGSATVAKSEATTVFTVSQAVSATTLTTPATLKAGVALDVSAAVRISGGSTAPAGFVSFTVNGVSKAVAPVTGGTAKSSLGSFPKGSIAIRAIFYSADGAVLGSSSVVKNLRVS
jgi:L-asparaginase